MPRETGSTVCIFALAFAALVVAKPPPPAGPWASYGKPVFSRALGPPFAAPGISSITVPYKPKASPLFPKFVDPTTLISKKTDLLSNLFGGLGPADTGAIPVNFPKYPPGFLPSSPVLYATSDVDETPETKQIKQVNEVTGPVTKDKIKRGAVAAASKVSSPKLSPFSSPFAPKFFPFAPSFSPFAPGFSPFAPSFSPFAPGYSSLASSFPSSGPATNYGPAFIDGGASSSRRRRSIVGAEGDVPKALGPPPAYPGLAPIAEEPESLESKLLKLYNPSTAPKEMLPGLFGPFSPYAAGPIDPSIFAPKKPTFLDFINSLPTPSPDADLLPVTEVPIPKSTIVPPGFWAPSSIIPGPTEYTDKVSTFLDKLFSSLVLNKTATATDAGKTVLARALVEDPVKAKTLVIRSIEDIKSITAIKDTIVDSIVSELGDLKADIVDTLDDYIVYQKSLPVPKAPKAMKKPFAAFFAPPTPDPSIPFKQKVAVLSQVFDMLGGLQKNISEAVQEAIKSATDAPVGQATKIAQEDVPAKVEDVSNDVIEDPNVAAIAAFNATLLDAIKSRLAAFDKSVGAGFNKPFASPIYAAPAKREIEDQDYFDHEIYENNRQDNRDQYKRAVQMQMHQGYQSMPPGAVESVQVGGGAVPGHQGGGIKLLGAQGNDEDWGKWSEWAEYFKNQNDGRKHHHNHH